MQLYLPYKDLKIVKDLVQLIVIVQQIQDPENIDNIIAEPHLITKVNCQRVLVDLIEDIDIAQGIVGQQDLMLIYIKINRSMSK